jgi:hypothetical protein
MIKSQSHREHIYFINYVLLKRIITTYIFYLPGNKLACFEQNRQRVARSYFNQHNTSYIL